MDNDAEPDVAQLQNEVVALVTAWADRGISPQESAMVLAAISHALLAKLGFALSQITPMMETSWRVHNGKL